VLREVGLSDSSSIELNSPSRCSVCIAGLLQWRRQSPACLPHHCDTIQRTGTSRRRGDDVDDRLGLCAVTETGGTNREDQTPIRLDGALRASGCRVVREAPCCTLRNPGCDYDPSILQPQRPRFTHTMTADESVYVLSAEGVTQPIGNSWHEGGSGSRTLSATDLQGVWERGSQSGRTALNDLADQLEVVNESSCLPGQLIINRTKSFVVRFGSFLEINLIHRTIYRFNMNLQPCLGGGVYDNHPPSSRHHWPVSQYTHVLKRE